MQHQGKNWNKEYDNQKLVTNKEDPQADTLRFLKFLKKDQKYKVEGRKILDLGSGTGRNSNYLAKEGNSVVGMEISKKAMILAQERANLMGVKVDYRISDIGAPYDVESDSIDIILDITSSNSLNESGREVYLSESYRVLKNGGYMFVRALCKDGNKNVKNLLKNFPGKEYDTYVLPDLNIVERVFSKNDIINTYSKYFNILHLEKKTNYPRIDGRVYKRDYWLLYLAKS